MIGVVYDRPITIQRVDEGTERWSDYARLHARVNKSQGSEYTEASATRSVQALSFRVRWDPRMKAIERNTQSFRVVYDGCLYNIRDTDDYMQRHREFEMEAVSYGRVD